jgi:hypothetical protein
MYFTIQLEYKSLVAKTSTHSQHYWLTTTVYNVYTAVEDK